MLSGAAIHCIVWMIVIPRISWPSLLQILKRCRGNYWRNVFLWLAHASENRSIRRFNLRKGLVDFLPVGFRWVSLEQFPTCRISLGQFPTSRISLGQFPTCRISLGQFPTCRIALGPHGQVSASPASRRSSLPRTPSGGAIKRTWSYWLFNEQCSCMEKGQSKICRMNLFVVTFELFSHDHDDMIISQNFAIMKLSYHVTLKKFKWASRVTLLVLRKKAFRVKFKSTFAGWSE